FARKSTISKHNRDTKEHEVEPKIPAEIAKQNQPCLPRWDVNLISPRWGSAVISNVYPPLTRVGSIISSLRDWFPRSVCVLYTTARLVVFRILRVSAPPRCIRFSPCFLRVSVVGFGFWLWLRNAVIKKRFASIQLELNRKH